MSYPQDASPAKYNPPHDLVGHYSSLPEVAPPTANEGKEVVPNSGAPNQPYYYSDAPEPTQHNTAAQDERRILGLRRRTFWIVLGVVLVIVIAAAVGGGVGGALSSDDDDSSEDTTTASAASQVEHTGTPKPTAASETSTPATTTSTLSPTSTWPANAGPTPTSGAYDCPADKWDRYHPVNNDFQTWRLDCDADFPAGEDGYQDGPVQDLQVVLATSIRSCIDQCVSYNDERAAAGFIKDTSQVCRAVAYFANIEDELSNPGVYGNCYFKNQSSQTIFYGDTSSRQEAAEIWN